MTPQDGITSLTDDQLERMLERSAKRGAAEALRAIGLSDESAGPDIREIRDLLSAWKATKRAVWTQVIKLFVTLMVVATAGGLAAMVLNYPGNAK